MSVHSQLTREIDAGPDGPRIGAFFDDQVHRYLGLSPGQGQVVYHFAIGHAVHDPRIEA